jgi:hypothetical protein
LSTDSENPAVFADHAVERWITARNDQLVTEFHAAL